MTWLRPGTTSEWLRLPSYIYVIDYMRTIFFRALWSLYAHFFTLPICAICQNDPFWSLWFLCVHCRGLIFCQFADWQKKNTSFCTLKQGTHKSTNWCQNKISMRAIRLCCFSLLAHLLHAAWPVSEGGFDSITMRALGSPTWVSLPGYCVHCHLSKYQCAHWYSGH